MTTVNLHKFKSTCSNSLFAVVLLFSFFTFSALSVSTQAKQVKAETTCVIKAGADVTKGFQYRAQTTRVYKRYSAPLSLFTALNLSRVHTVEAGVSFKNHSQSISTTVFASIFYRAKTIPENGEGDSSLSLG